MKKHRHKVVTPELFEKIAALGEELTLEPHTFLIYEGQHSEKFFLILEGSVEILKKSKKHAQTLTILRNGSFVGELALVDNRPRSASVRTLESTRVLCFDTRILPKSIQLELTAFLTDNLAERLRFILEDTVVSLEMHVEELEARNLMAVILTRMLVFLGVYILLFRMLIEQKNNAIVVFVPLMALLSFLTYGVIKKSGYPKEEFGLTLKNGKKSAWEAVLYSLPVMAIIVGIKWVLIQISGVPRPLFEPRVTVPTPLIAFTLMVFYALLAPLQELVARGALQSLVTKLIAGSEKYKTWMGILLANLLFTALHTYLGVRFAFAVFLPGFFFGWLYHRQKNLVGTSLAHAIIGIWALYVVNVWPF